MRLFPSVAVAVVATIALCSADIPVEFSLVTSSALVAPATIPSSSCLIVEVIMKAQDADSADPTGRTVLNDYLEGVDPSTRRRVAFAINFNLKISNEATSTQLTAGRTTVSGAVHRAQKYAETRQVSLAGIGMLWSGPGEVKVPYGRLRAHATDMAHKQLRPQMKGRGCTAVHSLIVDADAISTLDSSSRPLLKRYLDAMDSAPSPKPLLLSGGFRCPSATREDGVASDELRAYLQAASDLDNDVRQAVGAVMPLAVYFPEPSTLISEELVAAMPKRGAAAVWLPNASELLGFMKFAAEHAIRRANAAFKNAQALKKPSERKERSPERWLIDMFDAVRARLKFDSSLSVVTSCAPLQDAGVVRSGVTGENILRHMSVSTHFTGLSSATKYNNAKIGQGALTQVSHCPVHTRTPARPHTRTRTHAHPHAFT